MKIKVFHYGIYRLVNWIADAKVYQCHVGSLDRVVEVSGRKTIFFKCLTARFTATCIHIHSHSQRSASCWVTDPGFQHWMYKYIMCSLTPILVMIVVTLGFFAYTCYMHKNCMCVCVCVTAYYGIDDDTMMWYHWYSLTTSNLGNLPYGCAYCRKTALFVPRDKHR
jgi:hypothetical protein